MAILKDLIVHGGARILNGLNIDTINGSTVGSSPKFTDTTYTAMTASEATTGTATTARSISASVLAGAITERVPEATTTTPKVDGTASAGSETKWAKGDHVHPTDTSRAAVASPTFTGTPKAPTATAGTNTTQIATTAFVQTAISSASGNYVPITRKVNDKALSEDISLTATDIGLGNVGNFKAVSTVASQGLSTTEQANARANIGAGTSSLAIGTTSSTAAAGNHTHGNITNAGALQTTDVAIANGDKLVVTDSSNSNKIARTSLSFDGSTTTTALTPKGTFETFLKSYTETDPTVPAWAKASTKPTYTASEVGLGNVGNFKAVSTVASQGLTDTEKANARANIGAGTSSLTIGTTSSTAAAGNHTHGNITNGGALQTTDVAIADGDKLVVTDSSNSNKIARTSSSFDGSTTTKALTQKGTFETFLQSETSLSKGTTTGSGNAVTDISVSGHQITLTKGTTFLTSHQTIKQDGVTGATVNRFGTCTIAAGTAAKTVSVTTGTFSLEAGARVSVKFNNANTANSPTLNVNSTGAKNVFHKGSQITSGSNKALLAGVCDFIYDGTQWHLVGNYIDTDTPVTYSTTAPLMDGTAAVGTATTVSRSDHVHPSDTTKMTKGVDYVTAGQKSGTTLGTKATSEGIDTTASGNYSHAEGYSTTASGNEAHAEGYYTTASNQSSHAEGSGSTASGSDSHAEGSSTTASGTCSHAEGADTIASGQYSHAEGHSTKANSASQHVFGEYNVEDTTGSSTTRGTYVEIVGNGTAQTRLNARTLDWSGNEVLAGKLTVGAAPTADMDVATKKYVDDSIPTKTSYIYTATCPTGASTAAKVVTLDNDDGNFSLTAQTIVAVTFTSGNTATTPTLNVNNTGAKTIAINSSATAYTTGNGTTLNTWGAGETVIFTYTGTYWIHTPSGYQTYLLAPKASPALTGTPTAPTATAGTNTTQIATTAFVQTAASGKQTKPTITSTTLSASGWSNGSYAGLQTTYPVASYDIEIEPNGDSITSAQLSAWSDAQIVGSATTNTLKSLGTVPTVDIPIIVKVWAK